MKKFNGVDMSFHELPFWVRSLTHWGICGFLCWIGIDNPDAMLLILFIGGTTWVFCFLKEIQQGHW
jgi:hypothetical protein